MTVPGVWDVVAGTGHREPSEQADLVWTQQNLTRACGWLRETAGTRIAISGMARGFDMDWAEAALEAGLRLWACIPFEGQDSRWTKADKARYARLRAAASQEKIIGRIPDDIVPKHRSAAANGLIHKRNRAMVRRAGALLTVWEPGRLDGGTTATLLIAATLGMPGVHLDPIGCNINFQLPAADDLERFALHHAGCGHVAAVGVRSALERRHAQLRTSGHYSWRIRTAKPREAYDDGCDSCIGELADSASKAADANVPV